ncbi:MAG: hypothetical protein AB8B53_09655 [Flavobacteriales bacterium]
MNLYKYILVRGLGALFVFMLANFIYKATFYKSDIAQHADVLENLWSVPEASEAIYFGESSNLYKTNPWANEPKISQIIDSLLPELNVGTVDNSGLHSGTYLALIKNIPSNSEVHTLIITMNIRSFGATWRYAIGENYLAKTEEMLASRPAIINKFIVSLKEYDYKPDSSRTKQMLSAYRTEKFEIPNFKYNNIHDWDSAMAWGEWKDANPHLYKENLPLAASYIKNYAFSIDTLTNERLYDFDQIMNEADARDYKVVFNILDFNHEEGFKLVGPELKYLTDQTRDFLINRYEKRGALMVNNLYSISDSCFTDRVWPTEHYSLAGKEKVANKVAREMNKMGWNK